MRPAQVQENYENDDENWNDDAVNVNVNVDDGDIDQVFNPYQKVINIIGKTLLPFTEPGQVCFMMKNILNLGSLSFVSSITSSRCGHMGSEILSQRYEDEYTFKVNVIFLVTENFYHVV